MNKSETISELAKALSKAQGEMKSAKRDSSNPFFKSKYADLSSIWDVCRKPLADNGLSVTQLPYDNRLETVLLHSSGEWVSSWYPIEPLKLDPQSRGSALTYARRYAFSAILGIATDDDDDGESAMARDNKKQPPPSSQPEVKSEKETPAELKAKVGEALKEIDPLNWQVVKPQVEKLMSSKKKGWMTTSLILTTLKGLGATKYQSIPAAYESLNERGRQQFVDSVKAETPTRLIEEVNKLGAEEE